MSEDEKKGDTEGLLLSVLGDSLFGSPIFRCDKALAVSVGRSVGWSVCNAFVRRSTRRTLLAYLALFKEA